MFEDFEAFLCQHVFALCHIVFLKNQLYLQYISIRAVLTTHIFDKKL